MNYARIRNVRAIEERKLLYITSVFCKDIVFVIIHIQLLVFQFLRIYFYAKKNFVLLFSKRRLLLELDFFALSFE